MTDEQNHNQSLIEKIIGICSQQSWLEFLTNVFRVLKNFIQRHFPKGAYEVLEYESTLELK